VEQAKLLHWICRKETKVNHSLPPGKILTPWKPHGKTPRLSRSRQWYTTLWCRYI